MQHQNDAVIDLSAYRRKLHPDEGADDPKEDQKQVLAELAYHLLKAIQAVKKLPH